MDQIKIEEIIKRRKRNQKNSDRKLKIFLAVFLIGNILFFTSQWTLPRVYRDVEPSRIGEVLDLGDQFVSFTAWNYSKKDDLFEILVEVENLSLDGEPDLSFSCKFGKNIRKAETVRIIDNRLYVLHVTKIPSNFISASLTVRTMRKDDLEFSGKFYTTYEAVGEVSRSTTDNDYLIYVANAKIAGYEAEIENLNKLQQEHSVMLNNSVQTIESLEEQKKLQTEEEKMETDQKISKVSSEAERLYAEVEDATIEITELKEKINIQSQVITELKGGGAF